MAILVDSLEFGILPAPINSAFCGIGEWDGLESLLPQHVPFVERILSEALTTREPRYANLFVLACAM